MVMKKWESFSDNELLDIIRYGESSAYSELWRRHHKAAIVAAKNIAPHLDAQDLVSEAYLKIFKLLKTANGPTGLFRPYLYSVVRNLSADWSRQMEFPSEELDLIPDFETILPWQDELFDSDAATRAFGSLSDRWQTVLWYTEVEGLSPRHISQMMGISAHGVSVLASRAREALRSAWVEAHVVSDSRDQECHQTIQNLQRFLRRKLTAAASRQAEAHLKRCESCQNAANEFSQLNNQLALTLATLFVGAGAATALVAGFRSPATAVAASFGGSKSLGRGEVSASATGATGATGATTSVLSVPFVITAIATLSLSLASAGALLLPQFFSDNQHTQTASQPLSDSKNSDDLTPHSPTNIQDLSLSKVTSKVDDDYLVEEVFYAQEIVSDASIHHNQGVIDFEIQEAETLPVEMTTEVESTSIESGLEIPVDQVNEEPAVKGHFILDPSSDKPSIEDPVDDRDTAAVLDEATRTGGLSAGDETNINDPDPEPDPEPEPEPELETFEDEAYEDEDTENEATENKGTENESTENEATEDGTTETVVNDTQPADLNDESLQPEFVCFYDPTGTNEFKLSSIAAEVGYINIRITQPSLTNPVELLFAFEITEETSSDLWWLAETVSFLSKWQSLRDGDIFDLAIEIQLVDSEGNSSPSVALASKSGSVAAEDCLVRVEM